MILPLQQGGDEEITTLNEDKMQNYRWINYPNTIGQELKERYEKLADALEAAATEPITIVWAYENENWTDDNGIDPDRNCLLVTQHTIENDEATFGLNLSSHKLY